MNTDFLTMNVHWWLSQHNKFEAGISKGRLNKAINVMDEKLASALMAEITPFWKENFLKADNSTEKERNSFETYFYTQGVRFRKDLFVSVVGHWLLEPNIPEGEEMRRWDYFSKTLMLSENKYAKELSVVITKDYAAKLVAAIMEPCNAK